MRFTMLLAAALATSAAAADENWAVYGQATTVAQQHGSFRAPYSGENSLDPRKASEETTDITLYAGLASDKTGWHGASTNKQGSPFPTRQRKALMPFEV